MALVSNVYTMDPRNIGDINCSPLQYFSFPFMVEARHASQTLAPLHHVIFGGGGMLHHKFMGDLCERATGKLVSWGIGHNTHSAKTVDYPKYMERFALHGVRDWPSPYEWVPCASCMHTGFDCRYSVQFEAVVYDHHQFPTGVRGLPTMSNDAPSMNTVLAFLGSADLIVTSSYHGAYWGTLLGRRVVVTNPFSTKFQTFRHPPVLSTSQNWIEESKSARTFPGALEESRRANINHHKRVIHLLLSAMNG
jgi:hypothetical protein